jgi:hypothetical protein
MQIKARDSSEVSVGTRTTTAGTSAGNANHFDCFKGSSVKKDAQIELKKESVRTNIAASLEAVAKAPTLDGFVTIDSQLASFNGLKQFETLNSFTKLQTKDWSKQSYVSEIPK